MKDILKTYTNYANVSGCMSVKGKLINLPENIWDALDADAERCKRSVTKQIEAILSAYFEIENVELNTEAVNHAKKINNRTGEKITGKVNPVGAAEFPKLKNVKDFPAIRTKKELEEKIRELGIRPETVGVVGDFKDYTPEQFLDFYLDIKEQRDLAQKQIDNREKIKKQKIS